VELISSGSELHLLDLVPKTFSLILISWSVVRIVRIMRFPAATGLQI